MTVLDSSGIRSSALQLVKYKQNKYQDVSPVLRLGHSSMHCLSSSSMGGNLRIVYLNPSFLYPAASAYHFANGVIHLFNQGRLMMNFVREGADMIARRQQQTRCDQKLIRSRLWCDSALSAKWTNISTLFSTLPHCR